MLVLAAADLRRRLRDRSALVQGVLAPVGLALIVGLAFGGGGSFEATIGVADGDGSATSQAAVEGLLGGAPDEGPVRFAPVAADEARAQVADGTLDAALVVPEGFGASVLATGRPEPLVVVRDAEQGIAADVAASVASSLAAEVDARRVGIVASLDAGPQPPDPARVDAVTAAAEGAALPVALDVTGPRGSFDVVAWFAPAMAILFLFLTMGASARTLLADAQDGILARVRAAPVTTGSILAGSTLGVVLVGLVAFLAVWAVTALGFGTSWGDPLGVLLVIVAVVAAIAGISTLITGVARTPDQADGLSSGAAFVLALLGGNFLAPGSAPDALRTVSLATPNGWALRAFTELGAGEATPADLVGPVAVLLGVGVACGALGSHLLARRLAS